RCHPEGWRYTTAPIQISVLLQCSAARGGFWSTLRCLLDLINILRRKAVFAGTFEDGLQIVRGRAEAAFVDFGCDKHLSVGFVAGLVDHRDFDAAIVDGSALITI